MVGTSTPHTPRCTKHLIVAAGVCFFGLFAPISYGQSRYQWQPVPAAAYYQGSYSVHGNETAFRTTSFWLLLSRVAFIDIEAYDADGHSLGPVKVARILRAAEDSVTGLSGKSQKGEPISADWDPLTDDDAEVGRGSSSQFGAQQKPAKAYMTVNLGLGGETMTAQGGIDSFRGSCNIGSTELRGEWQREDTTWYLFGTVEAHNFQTVDSTTSQTGQKFLRATARTIVFYDLNAEPRSGSGTRIGIGLGLGHSKMPVLGTTDQFSGSATLRDQSSTGLLIAVNLAVALNPKNALVSTASYQVPTFNNGPKALGAMADSAWRWSWDGTWFSDLGASWQWTKFTSDQSCAVATCQNFSQATSNLYVVHGGLGRKF